MELQDLQTMVELLINKSIFNSKNIKDIVSTEENWLVEKIRWRFFGYRFLNA